MGGPGGMGCSQLADAPHRTTPHHTALLLRPSAAPPHRWALSQRAACPGRCPCACSAAWGGAAAAGGGWVWGGGRGRVGGFSSRGAEASLRPTEHLLQHRHRSHRTHCTHCTHSPITTQDQQLPAATQASACGTPMQPCPPGLSRSHGVTHCSVNHTRLGLAGRRARRVGGRAGGRAGGWAGGRAGGRAREGTKVGGWVSGHGKQAAGVCVWWADTCVHAPRHGQLGGARPLGGAPSPRPQPHPNPPQPARRLSRTSTPARPCPHRTSRLAPRT